MDVDDDDWTILSYDSEKVSPKELNCPIQKDPINPQQGNIAVSQGATETDATSSPTDSFERYAATDELIVRRSPTCLDGDTNQRTTVEPTSSRTQHRKDCTRKVEPSGWEITPCTLAMLVGAGCIGILAFLSMK